MAADAKKDFRKEIKTKLKALTEDQISEQSGKAQDLILGLKQYKDAQTLSVYLSMPKAEAQSNRIVHDALIQGKKVFVPYIHQPRTGPKIIDMLRLASVSEFEGLARDSWGIPSLPSDSVESRENAMGGKGLSSGENPPETEDGEGRKGDGTLDLIVMPGVAFDQGMNRLGHGRGFYDAYLSRFCADGTRKPYLGESQCYAVSLPHALC
jgi:5-formyltetrahydrofolate cyclo-ligase